ncbi:MAG TPA: nuclear transport factor 2 family protein [Rhodanobacteraceae bacterium]|nr:nuclear transport factor 2 family protein [Rhodanobacteraceae bacterium]
MRLSIPVLLVIAASLCAIHPAHAERASPQLRDELVSLTQQLMDAVGEGKPDVWKRIVVDDAFVVDEFGRRQTAREVIAGLRPFPPGLSGSIEIRDPHANVHGDTAVLVCEEYERESVFGQQFTVRYIATNTFTRRGGAWKLVAMEDVTLPTQPPKLAVAGLDLAGYAGTYHYAPGRAWTFAVHDGTLSYSTHPGRPSIAVEPIARDVFVQDNDERNLLIFRRDASGRIVEVLERRKFNDLKLTRE